MGASSGEADTLRVAVRHHHRPGLDSLIQSEAACDC